MKKARGKSRCGFSVSSTMLTESSKPMIAKNASAAPLMTSANGSPPALNSSARAGSPMPWLSAQAPMAITINSPKSSMQVSTTLTFTDSTMPRKLIHASPRMNTGTSSTSGATASSWK